MYQVLMYQVTFGDLSTLDETMKDTIHTIHTIGKTDHAQGACSVFTHAHNIPEVEFSGWAAPPAPPLYIYIYIYIYNIYIYIYHSQTMREHVRKPWHRPLQ
jgi:hypothetical protein